MSEHSSTDVNWSEDIQDSVDIDIKEELVEDDYNVTLDGQRTFFSFEGRAESTLRKEGPEEIYIKEEGTGCYSEEDMKNVPQLLNNTENNYCFNEQDPLLIDFKDGIKKEAEEYSSVKESYSMRYCLKNEPENSTFENKNIGEDVDDIMADDDRSKLCFPTVESFRAYFKNQSISSETSKQSQYDKSNNDCELLNSLECHQKYYYGEKPPYKCQNCDKLFLVLSKLKDHLRIHTDQKPYKCRNCEKSFSRIGSLKSHLLIHTGEKPYTCQYCELSFSQLGNLKRHLTIHTGEKPFKCQNCDKSFRLLSKLKDHLRIHTDEKPFKCQNCGKSFNQPSSLKRHLLIHTGEKPYTCQYCEKSFGLLSILKIHILIHTGVKAHKCQNCEKSFSVLTELKRHMRVHTGEKPYNCQHCERSFSRLGILKNHLRIHVRKKEML